MSLYTEEELEELAEEILAGVDYDIFKEDLEERILLSEIAMRVDTFVDSVLCKAGVRENVIEEKD